MLRLGADLYGVPWPDATSKPHDRAAWKAAAFGRDDSTLGPMLVAARRHLLLAETGGALGDSTTHLDPTTGKSHFGLGERILMADALGMIGLARSGDPRGEGLRVRTYHLLDRERTLERATRPLAASPAFVVGLGSDELLSLDRIGFDDAPLAGSTTAGGPPDVAIARDTIYVAGDDLSAFTPAGERLWRLTRDELGARAPLIALAPGVAALHVLTEDGEVLRLEAGP